MTAKGRSSTFGWRKTNWITYESNSVYYHGEIFAKLSTNAHSAIRRCLFDDVKISSHDDLELDTTINNQTP